jgi:hypothetical protein
MGLATKVQEIFSLEQGQVGKGLFGGFSVSMEFSRRDTN